MYGFFQYKPKKCCNSFFQSIVDARRAGDKHSESSVVAERESKKRLKKREYEELRQDYLRNKGHNIIEILECNWRENLKVDESVKKHVRNNFLFRLPLQHESLLDREKEI